MAETYLGQIVMVGFNFAPSGWALCNGQLLPISQNQALFSLLGTTYGGNGTSTFALPNLQSRVAIHPGQGPGLSSYVIGQVGGLENVTLTSNQMPSHTHVAYGLNQAANSSKPAGNALAEVGTAAYTNAAPSTPLNAGMIGSTGGSQAHTNLQPYLVVNFIIALEGIYPSRN